MNSPQQCRQMLEAALFDNEPFSRLRKITTGCKLLSSQLPFSEINDPWVGDEELFKHLLLAAPFAMSTIELIFQAIISNYQASNIFVDAFWKALNFCSKLDEPSKDPSKTLGDQRSSVRQEYDILLTVSYIENKIKNQYARDVYQEFEKVKQISLGMVEILFDIFAKNKVALDSKMEILKSFLIHSNSDNITMKIMDVMGIVRKKYSHQCRQLRYIEEEIEQILIQKRAHSIDANSFLESPTLLKTGSDLEDNRIPQIKVIPPIKIMEVEENKDDSSFESNTDSSNSKTEQHLQDEIDEELLLQDDSNDVKVQMEKWLAQKQIPQLKANEDCIEYFKNEGNFEILMTFVIDPTFYRTQPVWKELYPELFSSDRLKDIRGFRMSLHPQIQEYGINADYIMRSYKTVSYITEKTNFNIISHSNQQIVAKLFHMIYGFFQGPDFFGNIYHIAKLLHFLIQQGPKTALYHILDYNLLFSLAQVLYNPYIFKIYLDLLNSVFDTYELGPQVIELLWQYIQNTQLFSYITDNMVKKNLDPNKCERSYKNKEISNILSQLNHHAVTEQLHRQNPIDKSLLNEKLGPLKPGRKPFEDKPTTNKHHHEIWDMLIHQQIQKEYVFSEELNHKRPDIDGFLKFIHSRNNLSSDTKFILKQELHNSRHESSSSVSSQANITQPVPKTTASNKHKKSQELTLPTSGFTKIAPRQSVNVVRRLNSNKWIDIDEDSPQIEPSAAYFTNMSAQKRQSMYSQKSFEKFPALSSHHLGSDRNKTTQSSYFMQMKDELANQKQGNLYPSMRAVSCTSDLERKSKEPIYQEANVEFQQMDAYACAHLVAVILEKYCLYESHFDQYNLMKIPFLNTQGIFVSIVDEEVKNFSTIFDHYLITLPILERFSSEENSAIECGKIVNFVLSKLFSISELYSLREKVIQKTYETIDYCCKVIIKMNTIDSTSVRVLLPNQTKLTTRRIMLVETLILSLDIMVKDKKADKFRKNPFLFLNETVLHILIQWFFSNKNNNIYQVKFSKLMMLIFSQAPEQIVVTLIFKLNLIQSLSSMYQRIVLNEIPILMFNIDPFLLHIKLLCLMIRETSNCRQINSLKKNLQASSSWETLTKSIELYEEKLRPSTFKIVKDMFSQVQILPPQRLSQKFEIPELKMKLSSRNLVSHKTVIMPNHNKLKVLPIPSVNNSQASSPRSDRGDKSDKNGKKQQMQTSKFSITTKNTASQKLNKAQGFSEALSAQQPDSSSLRTTTSARNQSQRKLVPKTKKI